MYICNALAEHGHAGFSLSILQYIDISNLSKENTRKLILEREQNYLDTFNPGYNLLKVAGSLLGFLHSEETKEKFREANKGENNPMYGRAGEDSPMYGITGENHPRFGKAHTAETKANLSKANLGKSLSAETKILISEACLGIPKTEEHKAKISNSLNKKVFVYSNSTPTTLSHEFGSCTEAAQHFSSSIGTISNYLKSGKLSQGEWILSKFKK